MSRKEKGPGYWEASKKWVLRDPQGCARSSGDDWSLWHVFSAGLLPSQIPKIREMGPHLHVCPKPKTRLSVALDSAQVLHCYLCLREELAAYASAPPSPPAQFGITVRDPGSRSSLANSVFTTHGIVNGLMEPGWQR